MELKAELVVLTLTLRRANLNPFNGIERLRGHGLGCKVRQAGGNPFNGIES